MMQINPVAGAQFFHFVCEMFIKHVLGDGVFGPTNAYYGTVEQQGRLNSNLHLLLWIKAAFSPQKISDRIMDSSSDFQQKLVEYLESVHIGEFLN
jgi:Helitron helicase-like domain at N-terminus